MAILIKNPEVEKRARQLAALTGETLTGAIDAAVQARLAEEQSKPRKRPTLQEMTAATERFRRAIGLDAREVDTSKAAFDALWEDSEGFDQK